MYDALKECLTGKVVMTQDDELNEDLLSVRNVEAIIEGYAMVKDRGEATGLAQRRLCFLSHVLGVIRKLSREQSMQRLSNDGIDEQGGLLR